jgi:putative transposase
VPVIPRTLGGSPGRGLATTVQRLYREAGLTRGIRPDGHTRLRWQADHPGALWHGDVCHDPLRVGQTTKPRRIHGLSTTCCGSSSRSEAHHSEREDDMLAIFLAARRRHGAPDALYLDNAPATRRRARQDGAVLAHAPGGLSRPPRHDDLAAR